MLYLQRPLKAIALKSKDVYIPRGVAVPALDRDTLWEFTPKNVGMINLLPFFGFLECKTWHKVSVRPCITLDVFISGVGDAITGGDLYGVGKAMVLFVLFIIRSVMRSFALVLPCCRRCLRTV